MAILLFGFALCGWRGGQGWHPPSSSHHHQQVPHQPQPGLQGTDAQLRVSLLLILPGCPDKQSSIARFSSTPPSSPACCSLSSFGIQKQVKWEIKNKIMALVISFEMRSTDVAEYLNVQERGRPTQWIYWHKCWPQLLNSQCWRRLKKNYLHTEWIRCEGFFFACQYIQKSNISFFI